MEVHYRLRSEVLAAAIERSRLSQNGWARRLGLSKSYLSQLVNGHRRDPSPEVRGRLLEAFDLRLDELFEVEHGPLAAKPRARPTGLAVRLRDLADAAQLDLRAAWRGLRRWPLAALLAIVALALGVGANSLAFSLVRGILLQPLPWPEAERVALLWEARTERGLSRFGVSPANFADWRRDARSFESLGAYDRRGVNLGRGVTMWRVAATAVDGEFFAALGIEPIEGRLFEDGGLEDGGLEDGGLEDGGLEDAGLEDAGLEDSGLEDSGLEDSGPSDDVVVLSDALRRRLFGPEERAIGASLRLDGRTVEVVGVVPAGLAFPPSTELWIPLALGPREAAERGGRWLSVVGRLADGVDLGAARSEMSVIAERLETAHSEANDGWRIELEPLAEVQVGVARRPLALLWLATLVVLAVACVDVAYLSLARNAVRRRELGVRAALGAGWARLVRQQLVETLLIALGGALAGWVMAYGGLRIVQLAGVSALPRLDQVTLDAWVLAFTASVAVIAAVASALWPTLGAMRQARLVTPRALGAETPSSHGWLVATQVALASTLLIVAALVGRSLGAALAVDPGFEPKNVLEARIAPPFELDLSAERPLVEIFAGLRAERARTAEVFARLLAEIENLPGVVGAAAINRPPLSGRAWYFQVGLEDADPIDERPSAQARVVTPGYFDVAGIRRLAGRGLEAQDHDGARRVAVVDRAAAESLFDGDAVGRSFRFLGPPDELEAWTRYEIVGVVETVRQSDLESREAPTIYFALPQALSGHMEDWGMTVLVRIDKATERAELNLWAPALRSATARVLPDLPLFAVAPMEQRLAGALAPRRLQAVLCGTFAVLTLVLAALGLYGVVATSVARRRRELGLRAALGAAPRRLVASACAQGLRPVAWGLVVGIALAAAVGRWLAAQLYGVGPFDGRAFAGATALLAVAAGLAAWLPARRAAAADPTLALRED
ncbi:MAG: ABC transporter permease [Acidobacteriota bacterium]